MLLPVAVPRAGDPDPAARQAPDGGQQPAHAAHVRRDADRAADVGADAAGGAAGGDQPALAAGAAAARARPVEGVLGPAEDAVLGLRQHEALLDVGAREGDGPGLAQQPDQHGLVLGGCGAKGSHLRQNARTARRGPSRGGTGARGGECRAAGGGAVTWPDRRGWEQVVD